MLINGAKLVAELEKKRHELAHSTLQTGKSGPVFDSAQGEYKAIGEIIELVKELAKLED